MKKEYIKASIKVLKYEKNTLMDLSAPDYENPNFAGADNEDEEGPIPEADAKGYNFGGGSSRQSLWDD